MSNPRQNQYSISLEGSTSVINDMNAFIKGFLTQDTTRKMSLVALKMLRERSESGYDIYGMKFAPYSVHPLYLSTSELRANGMLTMSKSFRVERSDADKRRASAKSKGKKISKKKLLKGAYFPGGYAQLRKAAGRSLTDGRLVMSGKMFNNLQVSNYGQNASQLHFPSKEQNAKAAENDMRYNFWGLSKGQAEELGAYVERLFEQSLKEAFNA